MGEVQNELNALANERKAKQVAVNGQRSYYANMLLEGGMGQDMMDVLDGKKKTRDSILTKIQKFVNRWIASN